VNHPLTAVGGLVHGRGQAGNTEILNKRNLAPMNFSISCLTPLTFSYSLYVGGIWEASELKGKCFIHKSRLAIPATAFRAILSCNLLNEKKLFYQRLSSRIIQEKSYGLKNVLGLVC